MLSESNFLNGINKLITEYEEKGFNPSIGRIKQWFEYMKGMTDEEFKQRIDWVLKNVSFAPSMADIFKAEVNINNTWKEFDFSFLKAVMIMQPISNLYNIQAEVEVLAAILFDNNSMTEINLRAEEFYDTKNKLIYKAMQELFNKDIKIDETNLIEYFKGNLQDIGGMSYLSNLIIAKSKLDKTKVAIIKEKARLRKLYETVLRAADEVKNNKGFEELYFTIQREIYNIDSQDEEKLMTDKDLFSKTFDEIENNQNKKDILGLKSGIVDLDKAINGFQNGRLYIIAGRSGMSKPLIYKDFYDFYVMKKCNSVLLII